MSNLPLGNLSIDELVWLGMDSDHPVLAELCRRLSPKTVFGVGGQLGLEQCKGKTILDAREIGDRLVLLFDGGMYFVVGADNDDLCGGDDAHLNFDVSLTMSEKLRLGLASASEWDAYVQAEKQKEQERRQAEITQLEGRLAVLRDQGMRSCLPFGQGIQEILTVPKLAKHSTPLFLERIHARHAEKQAEKRKAEERRQQILLALNLASVELKASTLAARRRRSRTRKGLVDRLEDFVFGD